MPPRSRGVLIGAKLTFAAIIIVALFQTFGQNDFKRTEPQISNLKGHRRRGFTGALSLMVEDDLDSISIDEAINNTRYQSIFDRYRMFKYKSFFFVGTKWTELSENRKVCLGSQSSIDKVHHLIGIVDTWSGPISVAVFAPDAEFHITLNYLKYLRKCFPKVGEQISFHVAFPVDHDISMMSGLDKMDFSCNQDPKELLKKMWTGRPASMLSWRETFAYPQNFLRNLAKSGCQTNYTFIPDIDMIPVAKMDADLEAFLATNEASNCKLCAFVIPTYEISTDLTRVPANKTELRQLVKEKKARIFHEALFSPNQGSSNLKQWISIAQTDSLKIAYKVEQYKFFYEPLYVALASETPIFDERFIGFGMTRNTQAYEMFVKGFTFHLLSNVFTSHWGFQTIKTRPKWRAKQQANNYNKFDNFAKELMAKYGKDPYNMRHKLLSKSNLCMESNLYGKDDKKDKEAEKKVDDKK